MSTMSPTRAEQGYQLAANEGEALWLLGMLQTVKIGRDDTNGAYGLLEIVVPEGIGSPWHVHPEEDEWFYVLEGEISFWVADTHLTLTAGSFAFGPKGVAHTFYAEAGGAKALVGFAPMQFEGFLREVGEPAPERVLPPPLDGPPDVPRLMEIGKRNGLEILGPPGPPPGH
jgi:quercetin dioxygenase-like cupin family protein